MGWPAYSGTLDSGLRLGLNGVPRRRMEVIATIWVEGILCQSAETRERELIDVRF